MVTAQGIINLLGLVSQSQHFLINRKIGKNLKCKMASAMYAGLHTSFSLKGFTFTNLPKKALYRMWHIAKYEKLRGPHHNSINENHRLSKVQVLANFTLVNSKNLRSFET